jgi:hypothetical protein
VDGRRRRPGQSRDNDIGRRRRRHRAPRAEPSGDPVDTALERQAREETRSRWPCRAPLMGRGIALQIVHAVPGIELRDRRTRRRAGGRRSRGSRCPVRLQRRGLGARWQAAPAAVTSPASPPPPKASRL